MTNEISFEIFEELFKPPLTRVLLNWDGLRSFDPPVKLRAITEMGEAASWFSPWYEDRDGQAVDFDSSPDRPLRFGEIAQQCSAAVPRWDRVRAIGASMAGQAPSVLLVPTYDLGDAGQLVLDGNHRIAAIVGFQLENWRIAALSVFGPLSPDVLPDLGHFE